MQKTTLALSVHRPEMIFFVADEMRRHAAIFLEEPPAEGFEAMLAGGLDVEDYLQPLDVEYPAFSRQMCRLLQELKAEGKKIVQVEPYMEILLGIHDFFADGGTPADLDKTTIQYPVYLAERNATGALLAYYQAVMGGSFEKTLEAVKAFARSDAACFRLRDSLRAQALAPLVQQFPSAYIEAGVIHYPLWRLLRQNGVPPDRLRLLFSGHVALKKIGKKGHTYGPGDQLTFLYVFHPAFSRPRRETLLAARALIYSKIITKDEITDNLGALPHLSDELSCIQMTRRLSMEDCRRLFPLVRRVGTIQALQIVEEYLANELLPLPENSGGRPPGFIPG